MILINGQQLNFIPKRIVSLVPSQTELLNYLKLEEETIGITRFCIHPNEWFRSKMKIGGTKTIDISAIKKLQPDLIIANKEENLRSQIEELATEFNVLVTDVNNVEEALQMILQIGQLTGKTLTASTLVTSINKEFLKLNPVKSTIKTVYLIWNNPYMTIGCDTFINDILTRCGLINAFHNTKRYPAISIEQMQTEKCKLILLSSEPYPFKQKHIDELQQHLPKTKIILTDGEMFSWYGSRMLMMPSYLNHLLAAIDQ
jgi:ABC-type Fe3+-hydroxamate transport system substrate-binding protein